MRSRLIALLALGALAIAAGPADAKPRAAKRLVQFDSCRALVGYARQLPSRPQSPRPGDLPRDVVVGDGDPRRDGEGPLPVPAAGEDSSTTNVQEAGVDEPDTVKTDGTTIFALARGTLHAIDARARDAEAARHGPAPRERGARRCCCAGAACSCSGAGRAARASPRSTSPTPPGRSCGGSRTSTGASSTPG